MKLKYFIILFLISGYVNAFTGKIQFLNYNPDSSTVFLVMPKNIFEYDTISSNSRILNSGFEIDYKSEKPFLAYISINEDNYGPFYLGAGTIKIEHFTSANQSQENDNGSYIKNHYFFDGIFTAENKIISDLSEMLKYNYTFTFKIDEESDRDSIFISKELFFAKIDSASTKMKTMVNTTFKENLVLKNYFLNAIYNYTSSFKLQYLSYKKYYDKNYDWASIAKEELAFFKTLPATDIDPYYVFSLQCYEYLLDTTSYYNWGTTIIDNEETVEIVEDEITTENEIIAGNELYLDTYYEQLKSIKRLNNTTQEEILVARILNDAIYLYDSDFYLVATVEEKIKYEEAYDKILNDYLTTYNKKDKFEFLKKELNAKKALTLNSSDYSDAAVVVDTAYADVDGPKFPTDAFELKNGDSFNLPLNDKKPIILTVFNEFPQEKDLIYAQYLEKTYKKTKFFYIFDSLEDIELFSRIKLKGKIMLLKNDEKLATWEAFFYDNYSTSFIIYGNGAYTNISQDDLKHYLTK